MKIVLVTGSRTWDDEERLVRTLEAQDVPFILVHGDCPRGADYLASKWAQGRAGVTEVSMPANWDAFGARAGMMRNSAMVRVCKTLANYGHDVQVLAFPRGKSVGTMDCVSKALAERFNVHLEDGGVKHD